MLRKCDGFILTDLFLSLSALFLIGALLMPLLTKIYESQQNVQSHHIAVKLLYESLMESEAAMMSPRSETFLKDGVVYSLILNKGEVCVSYERNGEAAGQVCESIHQ